MREIAALLREMETSTLRRMLTDLEHHNHQGRDDWTLIKAEIAYRRARSEPRYNYEVV
jgi:hypothetical protein